MLRTHTKNALILFFIALTVSSCKSTISLFDQYAYTQVTSVKVDALNIMDLATDDIANHKQEIKEVRTEMQKAYEYEKNRPKNQITLKMWDELIKPDGKLYGGFISFWQKQSEAGKKLSPQFIENEKQLIGKAFDQIAQLESKKIKNTK